LHNSSFLIHPGILQREINEPPVEKVEAGGASMLVGG
jgi:hypothetical protein